MWLHQGSLFPTSRQNVVLSFWRVEEFKKNAEQGAFCSVWPSCTFRPLNTRPVLKRQEPNTQWRWVISRNNGWCQEETRKTRRNSLCFATHSTGSVAWEVKFSPICVIALQLARHGSFFCACLFSSPCSTRCDKISSKFQFRSVLDVGNLNWL